MHERCAIPQFIFEITSFPTRVFANAKKSSRKKLYPWGIDFNITNVAK